MEGLEAGWTSKLRTLIIGTVAILLACSPNSGDLRSMTTVVARQQDNG